jgi:hypothetical protein
MPNFFNVRRFIEAREYHKKECQAFEIAIKNAINNAVAGMNIQTVCLGENKDNQFNFTIWGTVEDIMNDMALKEDAIAVGEGRSAEDRKSIIAAISDFERAGYRVGGITCKDGALEVIYRIADRESGKNNETEELHEALRQGYGIDESPPSY